MDLEYESWQLEEDCLGVFEHFDLDGDGQLSQEEFANLTYVTLFLAMIHSSAVLCTQ